MFTHLPSVIVFVRHPESMHNVRPLHELVEGGISNKTSPLTVRGEAQARYTVAHLKDTGMHFDAIFSSEYARTQAIPRHLGAYTIVSSLNERDMGVWHRLSREAVEVRYPGEYARFATAGYYSYVPPEGESCANVDARLSAFFMDRSRFVNVNTMLLSGHGVAGMCLRRLLTNETVETWYRWHEDREGGRMQNASVSIFEKRPDEHVYTCTQFNHCPWLGKV